MLGAKKSFASGMGEALILILIISRTVFIVPDCWQVDPDGLMGLVS